MKKMKTILTTIFLLCVTALSFGQIAVGVTANLPMLSLSLPSDFNINKQGWNYGAKRGILRVGAYYTMPLNKFITLQAELTYKKELIALRPPLNEDDTKNVDDRPFYRFHYLEMLLLLQCEIKNGYYIEAGLCPKLLLQAKYFDVRKTNRDNVTSDFYRTMLDYHIGIGYVSETPHMLLSFSVRYSTSFTPLAPHNNMPFLDFTSGKSHYLGLALNVAYKLNSYYRYKAPDYLD